MTGSDDSILNATCPQQYVDLKSEDIVVWVDPLDGTSEYTQVKHVDMIFGF